MRSGVFCPFIKAISNHINCLLWLKQATRCPILHTLIPHDHLMVATLDPCLSRGHSFSGPTVVSPPFVQTTRLQPSLCNLFCVTFLMGKSYVSMKWSRKRACLTFVSLTTAHQRDQSTNTRGTWIKETLRWPRLRLFALTLAGNGAQSEGDRLPA